MLKKNKITKFVASSLLIGCSVFSSAFGNGQNIQLTPEQINAIAQAFQQVQQNVQVAAPAVAQDPRAYFTAEMDKLRDHFAAELQKERDGKLPANAAANANTDDCIRQYFTMSVDNLREEVLNTHYQANQNYNTCSAENFRALIKTKQHGYTLNANNIYNSLRTERYVKCETAENIVANNAGIAAFSSRRSP